ncbi:hypothetical protein [Ichthyenterobacterium magnum]|uniref:Uncharacterized protein n=1 Tax=Ichthyenterobacterium magnum TaxID=1230530 RepID=A0A420DVU7_9FLAO|nr:hypothetical protein [Ichthyenterobacterium magnum]RKE98336.1 hypothetical protein BXY80_0419 [Ichthyenterobacterium magnum]
MELVLTSQDLEPLPKQVFIKDISKPEGLLNSNYKSIVKRNYNTLNSTSVFGIRQHIKSRQYNITSSIETVLKLSVFVIALVVIL